MPYNLLHERWLPVRYRDGSTERVAPHEIVAADGERGRPVAVQASRPDFTGALAQFLVGLIQTAFAPATPRDWRRFYRTPPASDTLQAAFRPFDPVFNLDGDGPRFMQELLDLSDEGDRPATELLFTSPSVNAVEERADHFTSMGKERLSAPEAAAALLTYQLYTTGTGGGSKGAHRAGLRGSGGPLTTLVVADERLDAALWRTVWLNVLTRGDVEKGATGTQAPLGDLFPWMAPTRTSADDRFLSVEDASPYSVFWATPTRIRLVPDHEADSEVPTFGAWRWVIQGPKYEGGWEHPLSPHTSDKDGLPTPLKADPALFSYRHWVGLSVNRKSAPGTKGVRPARVVAALPDRVRTIRGATDGDVEDRPQESKTGQVRLWAFGYRIGKGNKATSWTESKGPLFATGSEARPGFEALAFDLVETADHLQDRLAEAARRALYGTYERDARKQWTGPSQYDGAKDKLVIDGLRARFWNATEPAFYDTLEAAARLLDQDPSDPIVDLRRRWLDDVRVPLLTLFQEATGGTAFQARNPKATAVAERLLEDAARGRGKKGDGAETRKRLYESVPAHLHPQAP